MKAITAVCATGASVPAIAKGRISRHRDGENAEMQMYLSKLKDLVPGMPKNRKLSKLEVIQNVIDYICDLQSELETHPAVNTFDAAAALNGVTQLQSHLSQQQQQISPRQPLGVRPTPNMILSHYEQQHQMHTVSSSLKKNVFFFKLFTISLKMARHRLVVLIYFWVGRKCENNPSSGATRSVLRRGRFLNEIHILI